MSKRKVHWRPPSASQPHARCGVWIGSAQVTRDRDAVTCKRCLKFMVQGELQLEPIRGRPMEVTCRDGETERGQLIDAAQAGLELCRHQDGKRISVRWPHVQGARFMDEESQ